MRGVGDFHVGEMAHRIGLGPEAEATEREGRIGQRRDGRVVQAAVDLRALALDGQVMPHAGGNLHGQADGIGQNAVHDLEPAEGFPQRTGADVVVIFLVLIAEHDAGHLLLDPAHGLEAQADFEIAEDLGLVDQHRIMLVGRVLRELRQHVGLHRFERRDLREGGARHDVVEDDLPLAGLALARHDAAKLRQPVGRGQLGEIKFQLGRTGDRDQGQNQ